MSVNCIPPHTPRLYSKTRVYRLIYIPLSLYNNNNNNNNNNNTCNNKRFLYNFPGQPVLANEGQSGSSPFTYK